MFVYLNGIKPTTRHPIQAYRYSVTSYDKGQSPNIEDHGAFDSFEQAFRYACSLVPNSADHATIWDSVRGYAVARVE